MILDQGSNKDTSAVDDLFLSLARGDITRTRSCFTANARIWHSFDCNELTVDEACSGFSAFIAAFPQRAFRDVRRIEILGGLVQRHLVVGRDANGVYRAWPTCVIVMLQDRLICRLDEYLDRAGSQTGNLSMTPGLD
jgi:hypothetical protein